MKFELSHSQRTINDAIIDILSKREVGRSICPSEVARSLSPNNWTNLMPLIRQAADSLKEQGQLEVLQQNKIVESAVKAKGPIRFHLKI